MTLGDLRREKKLKQADIAARMQDMGWGLSQRHISQYETGDVTPSLEATPDLARAYETDYIKVIIALGIDLSGLLPLGYEQN